MCMCLNSLLFLNNGKQQNFKCLPKVCITICKPSTWLRNTPILAYGLPSILLSRITFQRASYLGHLIFKKINKKGYFPLHGRKQMSTIAYL